MIAPGVAIQSEQVGRAGESDATFLLEFAGKRIAGVFATLNAAARQIPASDVGMAHQKDTPPGVEDDSAHAERHRTPQQAKTTDGAAGQARAERRVGI